MRFRITVRSETIELRGYVDDVDDSVLYGLSEAVKPLGALVMASPAPDDYYPWPGVDGE